MADVAEFKEDDVRKCLPTGCSFRSTEDEQDFCWRVSTCITLHRSELATYASPSEYTKMLALKKALDAALGLRRDHDYTHVADCLGELSEYQIGLLAQRAGRRGQAFPRRADFKNVRKRHAQTELLRSLIRSSGARTKEVLNGDADGKVQQEPLFVQPAKAKTFKKNDHLRELVRAIATPWDMHLAQDNRNQAFAASARDLPTPFKKFIGSLIRSAFPGIRVDAHNLVQSAKNH